MEPKILAAAITLAERAASAWPVSEHLDFRADPQSPVRDHHAPRQSLDSDPGESKHVSESLRTGRRITSAFVHNQRQIAGAV
jgi:hypothetical protein